MASGRIVEIRARLGDTVKKGQLLMRVQSADLSEAFSDYRQAMADEKLAVAQLARSKVLFDKGAIAQKDLEVAAGDRREGGRSRRNRHSNACRYSARTRIIPRRSSTYVAPVSGVITDQQVTAASGTQGLGSPNAFTISDLSRVWVLCDVYENDLRLRHARRERRDSPERLPEHCPQGAHQQYRSDPRPQYSYRQGPRRSRESRE